MPHNFLHIGLILSAIPEAKVIHVERNPAATCWSNFKHYFSTQDLGYSYKISDVVKYYKLYNDLIIFWNDLYPNQIYNLNYEKLIFDQESEIRSLVNYVGLKWEKKCLSPHKSKRIIQTASNLQVRKQIYKGSSEAWRNFEPYLDGELDSLLN